MVMTTEFGFVLREYMGRAGFEYATDLAETIGQSASHMQRIIRGQREPNPMLALSLCEFLSVPQPEQARFLMYAAGYPSQTIEKVAMGFRIPRLYKPRMGREAAVVPGYRDMPMGERIYWAGFFGRMGSIFISRVHRVALPEHRLEISVEGLDPRYYSILDSYQIKEDGSGFGGTHLTGGIPDSWSITDHDAWYFLRNIGPLMILKQEQAQVGLELYRLRERSRKSKTFNPVKRASEEASLYERMKQLNKFGDRVSLPERVADMYVAGLLEGGLRVTKKKDGLQGGLALDNMEMKERLQSRFGGFISRSDHRWIIFGRKLLNMLEELSPNFKLPLEERFIPSRSL